MDYRTLLFERHRHVGILYLNRPTSFNSINAHMIKELIHFFSHIDKEDAIRCILLKGMGKAFSSGQDLEEGMAMLKSTKKDVFKNKLLKEYNVLIQHMLRVTKPIVVAVHGVAAGSGANLCFACDIILCSTGAKFIQSFVHIGLIPDTGGTYFLPRNIGLHNAAAVMISGDPITGSDAKTLGMVYKVFDDKTFYEETLCFAEKISRLPTQAIAHAKRLLKASMRNSLEDQLAMEATSQQELSQRHDCREGIQAFTEKRKPQFEGL